MDLAEDVSGSGSRAEDWTEKYVASVRVSFVCVECKEGTFPVTVGAWKSHAMTLDVEGTAGPRAAKAGSCHYRARKGSAAFS